jgi:protein SCO1/2
VFSSYRLGIFVVVCIVMISAPLSFIAARGTPAPAAQELSESAFPLGSFRLTERSGRTITEADLANQIWIASFIFTRCPTSCPRIVSIVNGLQQGMLKKAPVKFVSISVDPEHDTPEILTKFAKANGADPDRWWFLTGPNRAEIYDLILNRFHLAVRDNPDAQPGTEAILHSDRLALVGPGNRVIGLFSSSDMQAIQDLVGKVKQLGGLSRPWVRSLPALNATLNGSCAILLAIGLILIRTGHWKAHAVCMSLAVTVSAAFLTCYLIYHYNVGSVPFRGVGWPRVAYFTILISHTFLATFGVVPLVILTLTRAIRSNFALHAQIARITFPIWMYVSLTGVVIYLMLYQLPIPTTLAGA